MHRSENLFEAIDRRGLTAAEEALISERVALQQELLRMYEGQECQRQVQSSCMQP